MPLCFVSIGSNIDPERHVDGALQALHEHFGPLLISTIRETAAIGFTGAAFLNLVAGFFTTVSPQHVVTSLSEIEHIHDRVRGGERFAPRTLDLDLLLYGDLIDPDLKIPRAEIERYAFVLEPLAEIAPQQKHPTLGHTFAQLWNHATFNTA